MDMQEYYNMMEIIILDTTTKMASEMDMDYMDIIMEIFNWVNSNIIV